jgi:hypothetical protein
VGAATAGVYHGKIAVDMVSQPSLDGSTVSIAWRKSWRWQILCVDVYLCQSGRKMLCGMAVGRGITIPYYHSSPGNLTEIHGKFAVRICNIGNYKVSLTDIVGCACWGGGRKERCEFHGVIRDKAAWDIQKRY